MISAAYVEIGALNDSSLSLHRICSAQAVSYLPHKLSSSFMHVNSGQKKTHFPNGRAFATVKSLLRTVGGQIDQISLSFFVPVTLTHARTSPTYVSAVHVCFSHAPKSQPSPNKKNGLSFSAGARWRERFREFRARSHQSLKRILYKISGGSLIL